MKVAVIYNKKAVNPSDVINIFGPQTKERYNPKTVELVAAALEKGGHNIRIIEGNIDVAGELQDFMPKVMAGERPGMVFNMAYGIQGQSRYTHLPALLEMLGVPYVGSGPQAHAVALDKIMTKIVLQQHSLPTPDFWFFSSPKDNIDDVTYPVIVKPKMEAVSMGMKIIDRAEDLPEAVNNIVETYQQQALVERFIPGREFATGLLGNGRDIEVLPPVEFALGDPKAIQTNEAKLKQPIEKICPPDLPDEKSDELKRLAREAFQVLGLSDFARVDFRMDSEGNIFILEINSMASLGLTGSYVFAAKTAGYTYDTLANRMLDVAAVRYFGTESSWLTTGSEKDDDKTKPLRVRLRSHIRSNLTTMVDNLEKMVGINSGVYNTENVNSLGKWMAVQLKQAGFQCETQIEEEVGNILYFTNHKEETNDILLLGHLDTYYSYQDFVPFREERGRYYGSGVAESKGGLVVMLAALKALRYARQMKKVRCGILLITDDSLGDTYSRKTVRSAAAKSRAVVGLKCGGKSGGIVTSCGGRLDFTIEISNIKDTASTHPANVIATLAKKLLALDKLSSADSGIRVNVRKVEGRTLYGDTPDFASLVMDLFYQSSEQAEELEKEIRKIAGRDIKAPMHSRVQKGINRPPKIETEVTLALYERLNSLGEALEMKTAAIHRSTSSAISYVPREVPALEGLGPAGGDFRSPKEYILRDSLIDRATLLALLLHDSIGLS